MNKLEEQIQQLIISSLDIKGAADKASQMILADADFFKRLEDRLLSTDGYRDSLLHRIYGQVIEVLAQKYIEKHSAEILAKVDIQAVVNGMLFKAIQVGGHNLK